MATHPSIRRSWIEYEVEGNARKTVLVIETDLEVDTDRLGEDFSVLDELVSTTMEQFKGTGVTVDCARVILKNEPMPRSPKQEMRPAGAADLCSRVGWDAGNTSQADINRRPMVSVAAATLGRIGGAARANNLSKERRTEIAKMAAKARWG